jgi:hypothetical protein
VKKRFGILPLLLMALIALVIISTYVFASDEEPNDVCEQSHPVLLDTLYEFMFDDQYDWFQFDLEAERLVVITIGSPLLDERSAVVYSGTNCDELMLVNFNDDGGPLLPINLEVQPAGHYYLEVVNQLPQDTGGGTGFISASGL